MSNQIDRLKFSKIRISASACISALIGLSVFLLPRASMAQTCVAAADSGVQVCPDVAHVGDTITITQTRFRILAGECSVSNLDSWITRPDNATLQVVHSGAGPLNPPADCVSAGATPDPACTAFNSYLTTNAGSLFYTYQVRAQDVGVKPSFTNPRTSENCSDGVTLGTNKLLFFSTQIADVVGGVANGTKRCDPVQVIILNPRLSITKVCLTNCPVPPGGSAPYGQPINFTGRVCNDGDVRLSGVTVTDTVANATASITFSNLTDRGNPFPVGGGGTLTNGECVVYFGTLTPTSNLCGPFPDTVIASGTDVLPANTALCPTGFQPKTVFATNSASCTVCTSPAISVTKNCPATNGLPGGVITYNGQVCNTGNVPLTNVTVLNDRINLLTGTFVVASYPLLTNGECRTFFGQESVPTNVCSITDTLTARGTNICNGVGVVNTATTNCPVLTTPRLTLTKVCPPTNAAPGTLLIYTGTITNIGDVAVTNITLTDSIFGTNVAAPTPSSIARLEPGEGRSFTGSYLVPTNTCTIVDTVRATGTDVCGHSVSTNVSATCTITNTPALRLTKICPANPPVTGQLLTYTGTITNIGNIAVTNISLTDSIFGTNTTPPTPSLIPRLEPGQGVTFTGSHPVPIDVCSITDTVRASGTDVCGTPVSTNISATCPVTNTPALRVTKNCSPTNTVPGEITTFSGTVTNTGNVTLTNVIVVNDQPSNNTPVLGPITLLPGQGTNFSGSYRIPLNCCTHVDTLKATGADKCFGRVVTATATAVCQTRTTPGLAITKTCPPNPTPLGQPLVFSGSVSNSGNITLTNVTVVNNQPSNNTPVLGPITLAPGQVANFNGSYIVPTNICATNISDTVTARGNNICSGSNVTASVTASCPIIITPRLSLTKNCPPNPVPLGGLLDFSGTVSNSGNITITNIFVVNDQPTNNAPVIGPITLQPGAAANFTGSYRTCTECCPPFVDTLTATGNEACTGSNVTASATASCPGITTPKITVTKDCPLDPGLQGQPLIFSGTVSNAGDVALQNIIVTDSSAGTVAQISALAPGESFGYLASYTPTNCGPNVVSTVVASATDICTGNAISNNITAGCIVTCIDGIQRPLILNPRLEGSNFVFSLVTETGRTYTIQFTALLVPPNWQVLTSFLGSGTTVNILDSKTQTQRFYRVLVE